MAVAATDPASTTVSPAAWTRTKNVACAIRYRSQCNIRDKKTRDMQVRMCRGRSILVGGKMTRLGDHGVRFE